MEILNTTYLTRFAINNLPSLLDLIIVSCPSLVLLFDQLSFDVSDHDLLFCTYDINLSKTAVPDTFTFKDFSSIDANVLQVATFSAPWERCRLTADPNEKVRLFQSILVQLYDECVPTKTVRIQNKACPWFTSEVVSSIKTRNKLYSKWKRRPSDVNWSAYKAARNYSTTILRISKKNFYASKLNTSLPAKKLWSNLRKIGFSSGSNDSKCVLDPDVLNNFFLGDDPTASCSAFNRTVDFVSSVPILEDFVVATEVEITQCVTAIKSNSIGEDGLPIRFIKLILPQIISHLTHVINWCITTSTFPQAWKTARVLPIAKKTNPSSPADFRPVSILPCLSKAFEKIMAKQIMKHLSLNKLLYTQQSGFRANHSCSTAMVNLLEEIRQDYDRGFVSLLCLLDFSKAFDNVNHKILCWKLKNNFGFSERAVKLINSFLSGRSQRVVSDERFSFSKEIKQGVPQGSILGPILFCMFINDLPSVCKYASVHLYADDVQLHLAKPFSNLNELVLLINEELKHIYTWSVANGLLLNPSKSQVIPISKNNFNLRLLHDINLNNNKIKAVESVTSLGYTINRNLSGYNHTNVVIGRIYGCLRKLWISAYFTPQETRRKLVLTLVLPLITYAEVVYSSLDSLSQRKLQVAFNDAVRYIYGIRRYDHISVFARGLIGCTLQEYINARNCIFLHKIMNTQCPSYLYNRLNFTRSSRTVNLIPYRCNYLNSSRLFFIHTVRLWNSLPSQIKNISNPSNFKSAILQHFSNLSHQI